MLISANNPFQNEGVGGQHAVFVEDEGARRDVAFSEGAGVAPHGVVEVTETPEVGAGREVAVIVAGVVEEGGDSVDVEGVASLRDCTYTRRSYLTRRCFRWLRNSSYGHRKVQNGLLPYKYTAYRVYLRLEIFGEHVVRGWSGTSSFGKARNNPA